MAKFKKIIVAGPLVAECVYPMQNPRDSTGVRAGKHAMSSEAQRRMNAKYAYQKLKFEIAANFGVKDLFVTLTYDDIHLPANRAQARKCIQAFWRRLRTARRERGQELRYIYVTEHKHGDGRWHHHALINATGEDFDEIRRLWGLGSVEFKTIRIDRDKNFETLARYLCKEQREVLGARQWSCSRNLKKPERESFRVPNDTPLSPPRGAVVFTDTGDVITAYGHYRYLEYLAPGWDKASRPKARRRKRRGLL